MKKRQILLIRKAVRLLAKRCPRLARLCYWAGTSSIAIEELGHRQSFDLDFHTRKALQDVRPILAEVQRAFPGRFEVLQAPDEFGSAFRGVLKIPGGEAVTLEVLSNYEDVPDADLVDAASADGMKRVSLARYLADKVQCVVERAEARDLVDIMAVLQARSEMRETARALVARQDALAMAERLLAWTDKDIEADLKAYRDVDTGDAKDARDLFLKWLKADSSPVSRRRGRR
jgi:hypothetical protein